MSSVIWIGDDSTRTLTRVCSPNRSRGTKHARGKCAQDGSRLG